MATAPISRKRFGMPVAAPVTVVCLLVVLLALRFTPGAVHGENYWRAMLGRTLFFAIAGATVGLCTVPVVRVLVRAPARCGVYATVGAVTGALAQLALTFGLAQAYDIRLLRAARESGVQTGMITILRPGAQTVTLRQTARDSYEIRDPLPVATPLEERMLCSAEDERCFDRIINIDVEAYGRALFVFAMAKIAGGQSRFQGASDLAAQLAGFDLHLKPRGLGWPALMTKAEKSLVAFREDDLFSRREQIRRYLAVCPFGSLAARRAAGAQ